MRLQSSEKSSQCRAILTLPLSRVQQANANNRGDEHLREPDSQDSLHGIG
jgi:hypothetical protein